MSESEDQHTFNTPITPTQTQSNNFKCAVFGLKNKKKKKKPKNNTFKIKPGKTITVLSLINAPGALQFFKRGMFIRSKFSMQ